MRADCGTDQESSTTGGQTAAGRGGEQRSIRGPHDNWMTDPLWLTPTAIPSAQARSRFGLLSTGCFDVRSRSLQESAPACVDETFSKLVFDRADAIRPNSTVSERIPVQA